MNTLYILSEPNQAGYFRTAVTQSVLVSKLKGTSSMKELFDYYINQF